MTGHMELAFVGMKEHEALYKRLQKAEKRGEIPPDLAGEELVKAARKADLITADEAKSLKTIEQLRLTAIAVDQFAPGTLEKKTFA